MTDLKLFSTGTTNEKTMWYWEENPQCSVCKNRISENNAVYIVDWDKIKGRINNLMHVGCIRKYKKSAHSIIQYRWNVLISNIIPPKSVPVFINTPNLRPVKGDTTIFDVYKLESDKTTDNAWRSKYYPSLEGAKIGDISLLEDKDKPLELEEGLKLLREVRKK